MTSTAILYSRFPSGSNEVTSIFGVVAGRRPRSLSTPCEESLTVSSSTSPRTASPKRLRISDSGTLPGRKPGSRTVLARLPSRAVIFSSISAAGMATLNSRVSSLVLFSETSMEATDSRCG